MIRTDGEYKKAVERIKSERGRIDLLRQELLSEGLGTDELARVLAPLESFNLQLVEEVEAYERLQRGHFDALTNFHGIGCLLVSLRIYRGLTQRQLADKLGVNESQISRDERNEYHGISIARASRILEVLGATLSSTVKTLETPEYEQMAG